MSTSSALDKHLAKLRVYWRQHRAFPAIAELTSVLGMASTNGVHKTLARLVEEGFLDRVGTRYAPSDAFFALPLVGPARAGLPQPSDAGQAPEVLSVEAFLVDRPDQTVYCRVKGDSMRDAGLLDGDIVVVDQSASAADGDIVVAVVDDEITVKRLRQAEVSHVKAISTTVKPITSSESITWFLEPANPAYEVIHPRLSLEILGVVTGSFRRFRR
jgi:SOS-response transcriptional repressor LexA